MGQWGQRTSGWSCCVWQRKTTSRSEDSWLWPLNCVRTVYKARVGAGPRDIGPNAQATCPNAPAFGTKGPWACTHTRLQNPEPLPQRSNPFLETLTVRMDSHVPQLDKLPLLGSVSTCTPCHRSHFAHATRTLPTGGVHHRWPGLGGRNVDTSQAVIVMPPPSPAGPHMHWPLGVKGPVLFFFCYHKLISLSHRVPACTNPPQPLAHQLPPPPPSPPVFPCPLVPHFPLFPPLSARFPLALGD